MATAEWPGARVRAAFNEFFQTKAHTYWSSNAVVRFQPARLCCSAPTPIEHAQELPIEVAASDTT